MDINDIDGVRPRKNKQIEYKTRETMNVNDIEGAKAKQRHSPRQNPGSYNAYDYSDITKAQFVSTRQTNPLSPSYLARDTDGQVVEIGEVSGSKPRGLGPIKKDPNLEPSSSLVTKDIFGASAGTTFKHTIGFNGNPRKDFGRTNMVDDIEGAHAGSLKKGP